MWGSMSVISKLFWKAFARFVGLFLPAAMVVFIAIYFADRALIDHGLRRIAFAPAAIAVPGLWFLFDLLFGPLLRRMAAIRQERTLS